MGYNVGCDTCPEQAQVGPEGEIPLGWGTTLIEFYPQVDPLASEDIEQVKEGKGIKLFTCPKCSAMVETIGPANMASCLKEALIDIIAPTGG